MFQLNEPFHQAKYKTQYWYIQSVHTLSDPILFKKLYNNNNNYLYNILYMLYTGCPRRNVPDFGRMFLKLKYTDITQNTYIQS